MAATLTPCYSKQGKISNVRYNLPHRIFSSAVYPVKSPNGSTIIVYGHETGIRVVWNGGQHVDEHSESDPQTFDITSPEPELDPFEPYPHVTDVVDVDLASEGLTVAVPPLIATGFEKSHVPPLLRENIVVAVGCSDGEVRVVSLPLRPSGNGQMAGTATKVIRLGDPRGHGEIVSSLSMTWTSSRKTIADPGDSEKEWYLLVASCSAEGGGLLLIFHVDIPTLRNAPSKPSPHPPLQRIQLSSVPSKLRFNPSVYPSRRHSLLVLSDQAGAARVYDPLCSRHQSALNARPTPLSATTGDKQWPSYGSWLISYVTPYNAPKHLSSSSPGMASPKRILDVQWVLEGTGILAVLADGEWGMWRQDFAKNDDTRMVTQSGSKFILSGQLDGAAAVMATPTNVSAGSALGGRNAGAKASLMTFTPNTRKARQMQFFNTVDSSTARSGSAVVSKEANLLPKAGGISVGRNVSVTGDVIEESVIMWYGDYVFGIPSFNTYWTEFGPREGGGGSRGLVSHGSGFFRIDDIPTSRNRLTGISLLPQSTTGAGDRAHIGPSSSLPPDTNSPTTTTTTNTWRWSLDILFQGERWFGIWSNTGFSLRPSLEPYFPVEPESGGQDDADQLFEEDQALLRMSLLGLDGINRQLDMMMRKGDKGSWPTPMSGGMTTTTATGKKVGFSEAIIAALNRYL